MHAFNDIRFPINQRLCAHAHALPVIMIFEVFNNGAKLGLVHGCTSATQALIRGRDIYGAAVTSVHLKEDLDVTDLHKPGIAPLASPAPARPEVAKNGSDARYPHAKRGEAANFKNSMGTTPRMKPVIYPIKSKTHSRKFKRAMRERRKRCQDKERYPHSAAVHEAIRGLVSRPARNRQRKLSAYKCECGFWHIKSN